MSRSTQFKPREPIRDPNWRFDFGKYVGQKIIEVMACDPGYIRWLLDKTDFDVDETLMQDAEERYQEGMRILFSKTIQDECAGLSDPEFYK